MQPIGVSITNKIAVEQPVHPCMSMVGEWAGIPYAELSVMLVYLRYLASIHVTHHWVTQGDPFYGDHGLFQRLYESIIKEIDQLAEKVIGLGATRNVELVLQARQLARLTDASYGMSSTIPQASELVKRSLTVEQDFLVTVETLMKSLDAKSENTRGLENLIGDIVDAHEGYIYLLKQRSV